MVFAELIQKSRNGDLSARAELIESNLGLVHMLVNRFRGRGASMEDLFQIGSIGLIKAIDGFNPDYGSQFSTYAVPLILGEIRRYFRDNRLVSVSRSYKILMQKVTMLQQSLLQETGKEPTISELAEKLSVSVEDVSLALSAAKDPISLEEPQRETDLTLKETLPDKGPAFDPVDRLALSSAISKLEKRERYILISRYFRDETQANVAKRLGISQVQVSRLERKILTHLRHEMFS